MSNANSLELLPPRQSAQPAPSSDRSKKSDNSDSSDSADTKFKTKLATKLNALQPKATRLNALEPKATSKPDKPAKAAPNPASDPSTQEQTTAESGAEDAKTPADQATAKTAVVGKPKAVQPVLENAEEPAAKTAKPAKPATPVSDPPDQADQTSVKKQPADHKTASTATTAVVDPNAAAKLANVPTAPQPAAQATAQSAGDSDPDAIDGITPTTTNLFGSGKVVAKAVADGTGANATSSAAAGSAGAEAAADATVDATEIATPAAQIDQAAVKAANPADPADDANAALPAVGTTEKSATAAAALKSAGSAEPTPQARFVEANQPKIVSSIQGQLLPHGGTMQIRLDPPELGPMQVSVHMKDGVMTASFETTSEHATKLLSHTLSQLKSGLEAAGMNVQKLQVQQSTKKDGQSNSNGDSGNAPQEQQQQAQQEKQRREMVQRMWQKLAGGDPLDLVA